MSVKTKKLYAVALSALLIIGSAPLCASARELSGLGTAKTPYIVNDAVDMALVAENVAAGASYKGEYLSLSSDIALGTGFVPIGSAEAPFSGTFSGNGFKISADEVNCDYAGIFGVADGAVIKELCVEGEFIAGNYAGGIAALAKNTKIINCKSSAGVYADNYCGGIAGGAESGEITGCATTPLASVGCYNEYGGGIAGFSSAVISSCKNDAYIFGKKNTGGIAGAAAGNIISCKNGSAIEASGDNCGGIAGLSEAEILLCENKGSVTGAGKVGGIAGVGYSAVIGKCADKGQVTASDEFSSGIAGYLTGGKVDDCLFESSVNSSSAYAGGIFGYASGTKVSRCFSSSKVYSNMSAAGAIGGLSNADTDSCRYVSTGINAFVAVLSEGDGVWAVDDADILNASSYLGWDFENIWAINRAHSGYPILRELGYHTLSLVSSEPPTCEKDGKEIKICDVCGEIVEITLPALGHAYALVSETPPTCVKSGVRQYQCSVCGAKKAEQLPAKGHIDKNNDNICDVCSVKINPDPPKEAFSFQNAIKKLQDFFTNILETIRRFVDSIISKFKK